MTLREELGYRWLQGSEVKRLQWFQNVKRMDVNTVPRRALKLQVIDRRSKIWPHLRWVTQLTCSIRSKGQLCTEVEDEKM
jgi:hypothetical protein